MVVAWFASIKYHIDTLYDVTTYQFNLEAIGYCRDKHARGLIFLVSCTTPEGWGGHILCHDPGKLPIINRFWLEY